MNPDRASGEALGCLIRRRVVDRDEEAEARGRTRVTERVGAERRAPVALAAFLALVAGCGTSMSSRFYRMYPTATAGAKTAQAQAAPTYVCIGPVKVAAYLERPQIATRISGDELAYAEYDRWAGPLKDNISDVLVEDVSGLLSGEGMTVRTFAGSSAPVPGLSWLSR